MTTHIEQERPDDFDALEQELYRHQPVLSMHDGSIAGCQCMDRVFHRRTEDWGTHLAEVFLSLRSTRPEPPVTEAGVEAALASWFESATHVGAYSTVAEHVKERNRPRMRAALEAARATREGSR